MIKKLAVLLAVLALVAAACGDGDSDDTTSTTAGNGDTTTTTTGDGGPPGQGGGTLAAVIGRGTLNCGVSGALVGFSSTEPDGSSEGLDADYCRALAAAVLGDANAVTFVPLTSGERFDRLKAGDVDVLFRNTTWTASRDTEVGGDFGPTTYYDGQQLMGKASFGFTPDSGPGDVDGAVLCTNAGTTTEKNIREWAALGGAEIVLNTVEQFPDALELFKAGSCDLVTTDGSGLVANKVNEEQLGNIEEGEWVIFPTSPISKEPLGPMYRQNDSDWADVIDWVVYATLIAWEKGVNSSNVDDIRANTDDPELQRLFGDGAVGAVADAGEAFGIPADGFYQVIKQVGSYDEIFDRNLNPLEIFRDGSLNMLWTEGGLHYPPPFR